MPRLKRLKHALSSLIRRIENGRCDRSDATQLMSLLSLEIKYYRTSRVNQGNEMGAARGENYESGC
jgi:hypothetical protein